MLIKEIKNIQNTLTKEIKNTQNTLTKDIANLTKEMGKEHNVLVKEHGILARDIEKSKNTMIMWITVLLLGSIFIPLLMPLFQEIFHRFRTPKQTQTLKKTTQKTVN